MGADRLLVCSLCFYYTASGGICQVTDSSFLQHINPCVIHCTVRIPALADGIDAPLLAEYRDHTACEIPRCRLNIPVNIGTAGEIVNNT